MQLPWNKKQEKIEELEKEVEELNQQIEDLREEKESFRKRFEAEKERRSELSRKKQKAEKELKKLKQKQEGTEKDVSEEEAEEAESSAEDVSLEKAKRIIEKLESYESPEKDLVTVYSPRELGKLADTQGLKNSISGEEYEFISDEKFIGFIDQDVLKLKLKSRPFFAPEWERSDCFNVETLRKFISREKQWAVVSAGDTQIITEKDGEILEREKVENRIERKQKKGGFSQSRFERKRQEQIDEHLEQVEERVDEQTLLVGEERLCKELPGEFLGGFDDSRGLVDGIYGFRLESM
ncbi:MAG: Vms1/Ankzf1 family peptidyl-tRNA hydrolase [Candidatus Nanohalobium sp.]